MSLRNLAKHVQQHGRGEDTMLIHMTPNEVGGLQRLAVAHGGSLTINPKTGLPEAGFLSSILPMIAGAALAPFTGGLSAALIAGAGGGLYHGLKSGSVKQGLLGALGSGLGAYGGAGLTSGLGRLGARAALTEGAAAAEGGLGANAAKLGVNPAAVSATEGAAMTRTASPIANFAKPVPTPPLSTPVPPGANATALPANFKPTYADISRGATEAWNSPGAYMKEMGGALPTAGHVGAAAAPMFIGGNYENGVNAPKGFPLNPNINTKIPANYYQTPLYSGAPNEVYYNRGYAAGGHVDGMSDDIPATLPNGQAARLSHDEFVVPADVVSHIGNGSSEAGANRLYEMLERVRMARTGNVGQPAAINPNQLMPR